MSTTDPSILEGLAEAQAAFRPDIPPDVLSNLLPQPLRDRAGRLAVDICAGPGQSTRALRRHLGADWPLVAVEPVQDMRRVLLRDLAGDPDLQVLDSPAEALALPPGLAGLVVMTDRFRHVDARRSLAEMARVLVKGGVLGLLTHVPAPVGPMRALQDRLTALGAAAPAGDLPTPEEMAGFTDLRAAEVRWSVPLDARGLVDLVLSDPVVWRVVRRIGLKTLLPDLLAACASEGLAAAAQEIPMLSRAVTARTPG